MGKATEKFMEQRRLMHELCYHYSQKCGKEWEEVLYDDCAIDCDTLPLREFLIRQEPNQLQVWLDMARVMYGEVPEWEM